MSRHGLVVDGDPHERALAATVLRDAAPWLRITEVADASGLAAALEQQRLDVAVVARELDWIDGLDVVAIVHRRRPGCATVLLGEMPADLVEPQMQPAAHLSRSMSGIARLGEVVLRVMEHQARQGRNRAARGSSECVPVPLLELSADERILAANAAALGLFGVAGASALAGQPLAQTVRAEQPAAVAAGGGGLCAAASASRDGLAVTVFPAAGGMPASCRLTAHASARDGAVTGFVAALLPQPFAGDRDLGPLLLGTAHHLQQPLLTTRSSARMLRDRLEAQGRLDAELQRMLRRVVSGSERLETLLDGFLDYVRTGQGELDVGPVDLGEVVRDVVRDLEPTLRSRAADVRWQDLPCIEASRGEIARLFGHLVDNAVKFCGPGNPVVDIACVEREDIWLITVRDNGIGVDPEHAQRIFEPFERLHAETQYPGTGLGLAICRRIAERHGGRIWVTANAEGGSTFHVALAR